ncbi:MAG TPA: hypothetical protein VJW94_02045 [Candidatus Acidoferrum sp.]|nr:hypothetical protein [Candidatus Acidoferrum sp.]
MENDQPNGRRPEQIDFQPLWVLTRGAQALIAVICAKVIYLVSGTNFFLANLYSIIGAFLVMCFFLGRVATGTVDSIGIHYRLYFRFKTVDWADVLEIQWIGFKLRAVIKSGLKRKRVLVFLLNPLKVAPVYWAHRLGADVLPLEILERIRAQPIESRPTMASTSPYPKWVLLIHFGVIALFVLFFLWKLLTASPGASH